MKSLRGALDLAIKRAAEHVGRNPTKNDGKLLQTVKTVTLLVMTVSHWQEAIMKTLFQPIGFLIKCTHQSL